MVRSIKEVLGLVEKLMTEKNCRLILIKQNLDLDPKNHRDMTNKILLTFFSMIAELERDLVSEQTIGGLQVLKDKGIKLGKSKGVIQPSIYDKDHDKIMHLKGMGVPLNTIIDVHLKYVSIFLSKIH
ncbi:recombinase family protein [Spirosoma endbachense]|uniref:recombinase family protein n=1 Tax=Spirosoma endbachense TaxID=2666025 RepID=UPI0018E082E8|nr:recombinase family protein [Spirosoma endbachense]